MSVKEIQGSRSSLLKEILRGLLLKKQSFLSDNDPQDGKFFTIIITSITLIDSLLRKLCLRRASISTFLTIILLLSTNVAKAENLKIITCNQYLKLIIQEITQNKTDIRVTTSNNQPNIILPIAINKNLIDILACDGTQNESLWLNKVLNSNNKSNFRVFYAKKSVQLVNNNPYFYYNPQNIQLIANNFTKLLTKTDPKNAKFYQRNLNKFNQNWQENLQKWQNQLKKLQQNGQIITNNSELLYFFLWSKIITKNQASKSKDRKIIIKNNQQSTEIKLDRTLDINNIEQIEQLFDRLVKKISN